MDKDIFDSLEDVKDEVIVDDDINAILDTIYSLSHIRDIEGEDTPSYCFAHDITDIFGLSDEEVKDIALENGYNVFNVLPNEEVDGGLIIADKDCSKDLIVKDYEKFFGVDIDVEDIVEDDRETVEKDVEQEVEDEIVEESYDKKGASGYKTYHDKHSPYSEQTLDLPDSVRIPIYALNKYYDCEFDDNYRNKAGNTEQAIRQCLRNMFHCPVVSLNYGFGGSLNGASVYVHTIKWDADPLENDSEEPKLNEALVDTSNIPVYVYSDEVMRYIWDDETLETLPNEIKYKELPYKFMSMRKTKNGNKVEMNRRKFNTEEEFKDYVENVLSQYTDISKLDLSWVKELWEHSHFYAIISEYVDALYDLDDDINDDTTSQKIEGKMEDATSIEELDKLLAQAQELAKKNGQVPDGYEKFDGYLNDPYQPIDVGTEIITRSGEHLYITDVDDMENTYAWVSPNRSDISTGRGNSLHKDDIRFVKINESLKESSTTMHIGVPITMNKDKFKKFPSVNSMNRHKNSDNGHRYQYYDVPKDEFKALKKQGNSNIKAFSKLQDNGKAIEESKETNKTYKSAKEMINDILGE